MGFHVSWIARRGTSTSELVDLSGRSLTGERHEFQDVGWYLLELPKAVGYSWVILIADGSDNYGELEDSQAESLSRCGNETLYFWCSDTVMVTVLMSFMDGVLVWSVHYDCGDETKRPEITGNVPTIAHQLLNELRVQQQADAGADYIYDLTAELGQRLTGFRHDKDLQTEDSEPFQVLG